MDIAKELNVMNNSRPAKNASFGPGVSKINVTYEPRMG